MSERFITSSRETFALALGLFLVALAVRLPHSLLTNGLMWDELLYSLPTLREIKAGGFPIYAVNAAYMAPLQEWVSTALFVVFGVSYLTFRLPCVVFASLAVPVSYLAFRRMMPQRVALGFGLLLASGNSGATAWTSFSYPTWGLGLLLVACLQLVTLWLHECRTPTRWIAFGALSGASLYIFKLSQVQIIVSLGWLFLRSDASRELVRRIEANPAVRHTWRTAIVVAGIGAIPLAAITYHYFTRVRTFTPGKIDLLLVAAAAMLLGFAAVRLLLLLKPSRRAWRNAVLMVGALLLVSQPPMLYYSSVVRPRLEAETGSQWNAAAFSLKHAHRWPAAATLWLEGVFPSLLIGDADRNYRGPLERLHMGWRSVVSAAFFMAVTGSIIWQWRRAAWCLPYRRWVVLGPFLLISALLFPSSNLSSGWSFRYLLPFYSGLLMLGFLALRPLLIRQRRTMAALVLAFAIFGAIDSIVNTPRSQFDRTTPNLIQEVMPPNPVPRMAEAPK